MKFKRGFFDILAAIALLFSVTSFFVLAPLSLLGCVTPSDDLYINDNTTFCSGTYTINDAGATGAIIINNSNVILDCNGAKFIGNGAGAAFLIKDVENTTIRGCNVQQYTNAFTIENASNTILTNNTVCNNVMPFNVVSGAPNIFANHFCVSIVSPENNSRYFSGTNPNFVFNVSDFFSRTDCYVYLEDIKKGGTSVTAEYQYAPIRTLFYTNLAYQNFLWNIRCSDGNNTGESGLMRMVVVSDYQFPSPSASTPTPTPNEEPSATPTPTPTPTVATATQLPSPTPTPTPIPSPTSIIIGPSLGAEELNVSSNQKMDFIQQISYSITGKPINIDSKCSIFFVIPINCVYCWILLVFSSITFVYIFRKFVMNIAQLVSLFALPYIIAFAVDCGLSVTITISSAVILAAIFIFKTEAKPKKVK